MFNYLQQIDVRLLDRYLTVERNIKSTSNSFYDSYLDMLEQFVKTVLISEDVEFKSNETCGAVLKRTDVRTLFIELFGADEYTYNKMQDYTLKVNAHKHKGEKKIAVDTIVSYLKVFYDATSAYCQYQGIATTEFDANFVYNIFGIYEKENIELQSEVSKLRSELEVSAAEGKLKDEDIEVLRRIGEKSNIEKLSLEEQNRELQKQISALKDIKLSSMEEKLNRTIELLLELKPAIVENRVITRAVGTRIGRLIDGNGDVDAWIAEEEKRGGNA